MTHLAVNLSLSHYKLYTGTHPGSRQSNETPYLYCGIAGTQDQSTGISFVGSLSYRIVAACRTSYVQIVIVLLPWISRPERKACQIKYKREKVHNAYLHPSVAALGLHLFLDLLQMGGGQFYVSRANVTSVHEIRRIPDHRPVNLEMVMTVTTSRGSTLRVRGLVWVLEGTAGEPLQQ